jgi:hypothetical protein
MDLSQPLPSLVKYENIPRLLCSPHCPLIRLILEYFSAEQSVICKA